MEHSCDRQFGDTLRHAVTNLTLKREQKRNNETRIDIAVGNMGNLK